MCQAKIDRIYSFLGSGHDLDSRHEMHHSKSRLSMLSNQLQVEDDYESEGEVEEGPRLAAILEEDDSEARSRWRRRGSAASFTSNEGAVLSMDICDI